MTGSSIVRAKVRMGDSEVELQGEPEDVAQVVARLVAEGGTSVVDSTSRPERVTLPLRYWGQRQHREASFTAAQVARMLSRLRAFNNPI